MAVQENAQLKKKFLLLTKTTIFWGVNEAEIKHKYKMKNLNED